MFNINDYLEGMNSRPRVSVSVHLNNVNKKDLDIELSDLSTSTNGDEYRVLSIADIDFFISEEQAEKIFETLEPKLYEETFKEIEDKYLSEKVRADRLEEELEQLKEKYEGVLLHG